MNRPEIAVLIPCYNEEQTIGKVIDDFRKELPEAKIYVYNNNSMDKTYEIAKEAGVIVKNEYRQGKGHVIRSMFRDIEADVYLMVDGDDTYPADDARFLIEPVLKGEADMVIGDRLSTTYYTENKKVFNGLGNTLVRFFINAMYHEEIYDVMTGYRAFSRRFVKGMPVISDGFQIETEMTVYALRNYMKIVNVPIQYRDRPEGSHSKLNTYIDGVKVLLTIAWLYTQEKPIVFFTVFAIPLMFLGLYINSTLILIAGLIVILLGVASQLAKSYKDHLMFIAINQIREGERNE